MWDTMSNSTQRPLKIFLCHASANKPEVRKLYRYLRSKGLDPWLDEFKLLAGQKWQEEIPKALKDSDAIIIVLSKNSITKEGYVQREIKFALDKALDIPEGRIFIIPARLEECEIPESLKGYEWVDLFQKNWYRRLMSSLNERRVQLGLSTLSTHQTEVEPLAIPQLIDAPVSTSQFLLHDASEASLKHQLVTGQILKGNEEEQKVIEQPSMTSEETVGRKKMTSFKPAKGGSNRIPKTLINLVILSSCVIAGSVLFQTTSEKNFENAAATATAKVKEVASYAYYESFDNSNGGWNTGDENNDFFAGSSSNSNGIYEIGINEPKKDGYYFVNYLAKPLSDFDAYIEARRINGLLNTACYGLAFRISQNEDTNKFYSFVVCDNQEIRINYYSDETGWVELKKWSAVSEIYPSDWNPPAFLKSYLIVHPGEWNAIEVQAQGNSFKFFINNKMIAEITDSRVKEGFVAPLVTVNTKSSSTIWFDNFGVREK